VLPRAVATRAAEEGVDAGGTADAGRRQQGRLAWLQPRLWRGPRAAAAAAGVLVAASGALPAAARTRHFDLFGLSAADLLHIQNLSLLTWALLLFLPRWKHTPRLALVVPLLHSVLYTMLVVHLLLNPLHLSGAGLTSMAGLSALFRSHDSLLAGWLHYFVFDPLVGLGEVLDSKQQRVPHLLVVPCLLLTMLVGPPGFLAYVAVRSAYLFATRPRGIRGFLLSTKRG